MLQLHSALKAAASAGPGAVSLGVIEVFLVARHRHRHQYQHWHRHWQRHEKPRLLCKHSLKCLPRYAYAQLAKARTKAVYGRAGSTPQAHRWNLQNVRSGFVFACHSGIFKSVTRLKTEVECRSVTLTSLKSALTRLISTDVFLRQFYFTS